MVINMKMSRRTLVSPSRSMTGPLIKKSHHVTQDYNNDETCYDDDLDFYGDVKHQISPPNSMRGNKNMHATADHKSANNNKMKMMGNSKLNRKSLMSALPDNRSPPSSPTNLPEDFDLSSVGFYSPTRQEAKSAPVYSIPKMQRQSSKCSTVYESVMGDAPQTYYHYSPKSLNNSVAAYACDSASILGDGHFLPPVPEEMGFSQRRGVNSDVASVRSEGFKKATPVRIDEEDYEYRTKRRPQPNYDFLDEVQTVKETVQLDRMKKEKHNILVAKLKMKEAAIDEWMSKQSSKVEEKLEKIEKKLEKKRAAAVQKMHKKLAAIKTEADNKKASARQSAVKAMEKLPQQNPRK